MSHGFLVAGIAVFLGVHSIAIVSYRWRDRMAAKLGPAVWRLLFSLVSILGLALIFYGYGQARSAPIILYVPPLWLRDTMVMLMPFVFPLVFAAYFPGLIKTIFKHPMLVAVKLWAFMHLLVNGSLADVLLFGSVLAWAVADRISLKRRPVRPIHTAPPGKWNDAIAVTLGFAVYVALLAGGHRWLTGMPIAFAR
jgi:uncharacterized membrane protein